MSTPQSLPDDASGLQTPTRDDPTHAVGSAALSPPGLQRADDERHRQDDQFRALVDNSPDLITRFDLRLRHVYVNPAVERITGQPAAAFIGRTNEELGMPADLCAQWNAAMRRALDTGTPQEMEFEFAAPTGTFAFHSRLIPEFGPDGRVASLLGVTRDKTAERQAEQALRESEARYRTLAELSPDATLIAADMRFEYANAAAARLLGAERVDQIIGRDCFELIAPEYHDIVRDRIRQTYRDQRPNALMESRWRRLDGSLVDVEVSAAVVAWRGAPAIQVVVRDITERKQAEREREASLARFAALIENMPDGILIETQDRTIFGVNTAFCELFGMQAPPAALLGADCSRAADQVKHLLADPDRFAPRIAAILAGAAPVAEELIHFADKRVFERDYVPIVVASGDFIGHMWRYRDVTRRQRMEEALRTSEERHRLVVQASDDVIWDWSLATGQVMWSQNMHRVFGYPAEEANLPIEQALDWWSGRIHPDDRDRVRTHFEAAVKGGGNMWREEYRFRRADGVYAAVIDIGYIGRDPEGAPSRMVGSMRDVTELERARTEAEAASQAKSRFLSTLSHELRTPLTAVIGVADLLASDVWGALNAEQREHLGRIKASAWHLVRIIDEILIFTRSEAGKEEVRTEAVDLAEIARGVVDMLTSEAVARGLALDLTVTGERTVAFTDGGKARQILVNLVGNAIKYTDAGRVDVVVEGSEAHMIVRVRDTGPGIPADRLEDIFEPFVQIDGSMTRAKGGAGLGLTICRRLARLLGGEVMVESRPSGGSIFTLLLPIRTGEEPSLPR